MSANDPEWDYDLLKFRPIADNMVKARWLQEYVISRHGIKYHWTKLGLVKIKQLSDIWNELGVQTFDPQHADVFWTIVLRAAIEHKIRKSF
jgi:hypothetical protein